MTMIVAIVLYKDLIAENNYRSISKTGVHHPNCAEWQQYRHLNRLVLTSNKKRYQTRASHTIGYRYILTHTTKNCYLTG